MTKHNKFIDAILILTISAVCFFCLAKVLYENDNKYTDDSLQPIGGILALSQEDVVNDVFFLANGWQYFDNALLTPNDFALGFPDIPMQFVTIGKYNNFALGTQHKSPYGVASYRLILDLPTTPTIYMLDLPEIYSTYNLYINDTLMLSMGNLEKLKIGKQSLSFVGSGKTEILIATSNNSHYYSGMTFPPAFGLSTVVAKWQDTALLLHVFVIVLISILCLFALYFGIKLRNKRTLQLSLLAFFLLIQSAYSVFFRFFVVESRWVFAVEIFSIYAIYLLIINLQRELLNKNTIN